MTTQHTLDRTENSRETPPKQAEHAAIELEEHDLKRVVGGFFAPIDLSIKYMPIF
jgi:hypothetical protein